MEFKPISEEQINELGIRREIVMPGYNAVRVKTENGSELVMSVAQYYLNRSLYGNDIKCSMLGIREDGVYDTVDADIDTVPVNTDEPVYEVVTENGSSITFNAPGLNEEFLSKAMFTMDNRHLGFMTLSNNMIMEIGVGDRQQEIDYYGGMLAGMLLTKGATISETYGSVAISSVYEAKEFMRYILVGLEELGMMNDITVTNINDEDVFLIVISGETFQQALSYLYTIDIDGFGIKDTIMGIYEVGSIVATGIINGIYAASYNDNSIEVKSPAVAYQVALHLRSVGKRANVSVCEEYSIVYVSKEILLCPPEGTEFSRATDVYEKHFDSQLDRAVGVYGLENYGGERFKVYTNALVQLSINDIII